MKSIREKIEIYKENLDLFEDGMDKYKFLIDQAKNAVPFPEEYRNDSFKVSGFKANQSNKSHHFPVAFLP